MTGPGVAGPWVADPRIGWRILLTATLPHPPDAADVAARLERLYRDQSWGTAPAVRPGPSLTALRAGLVGHEPDPVLVGLAATGLVVSAHHRAVDGLGLLRVLEALGRSPVTATLGPPAHRAPAPARTRAVARRLIEVAVRPPARVDPPTRGAGRAARDDGDIMVTGSVAGGRRTTDLVVAAADAVRAHLADTGRTARNVAIAVGVGVPSGSGEPIADRSGLLRLRDVERLDRAQVRAALRSAPLEPPPTRGMGPGLRLLAPRLGSTMLVSHLGEVVAPDADRLAFHPVTAGGTGISLGAVTHAGRTVVGLRARARTWDEDGLERLLGAVLDGLRR